MHPVGDRSDTPQRTFELGKCLPATRHTNGDVVESDPTLLEAIPGWRPGQRCAQDQPGACLQIGRASCRERV